MIKKINILIVDDEEELVENLKFDLKNLSPKMIESIGTVYSAQNGVEALRIFKDIGEEHIDIVISDIKMPRMNGLAFGEKVMKLRPGIILIFLTAHGDGETKKFADSLNAFSFLSKPYKLWDLGKLITASFDRKKLACNDKKLKFKRAA